jgi:hypothetical protein
LAQFGGYGGDRRRRPDSRTTGLAGWLLGQQAFFYQALAVPLPHTRPVFFRQ